MVFVIMKRNASLAELDVAEQEIPQPFAEVVAPEEEDNDLDLERELERELAEAEAEGNTLPEPGA